VHLQTQKEIQGKKLKKLCDVNSNPLMENLSSFLSLKADRFFARIVRNSRQKTKGRRWNLIMSLLKCSPKSYVLLHTLLPLPSRQSLQTVRNTVPFRTGIDDHVFRALQHTLQKMSLTDQYCLSHV
jgi:hypothetical protein